MEQQYGVVEQNDTMSVGQYVVMMLIGIIPIVGIIMWFVWAFGSNTNTNKKNFARAYLIFILIGIGLSIVISVIFGAAIAAMMAGMGGLSY